jgi:phosphoribosyl 1,2-cyclic phosphate phosphodiesterase
MNIFVIMKGSAKITVLGTGTSQGIPVIACECAVCQSIDARDKRLRASIMMEIDGKVFIIDTGPDFRQQMLTHQVKNLTAILFTHEHKDHVAGLDDVRAFNFSMQREIDVYAELRVQESLRREYAYIFAEDKYPGVPQIKMNTIQNELFSIEGIAIMPVRAYHYKLPVFGYRIGNFAYLTDVKTVPADEREKLHNLDILILNALRKDEHISHMNLTEAIQLIDEVKPKLTYLTHLSHSFGLHAYEEPKLPLGIKIAFDGLVLSC